MADNPTGLRELVVIEEGLLASMATNAAYLREFPFLASLGARQAKPGKCGGCGRGNAERSSIFGAAKAAIGGMAAEKKRRLREMLNARHVRVTYINNSKRTIQLTF